MTVFVALVLTIVAFAVIAYPFFRQRMRPVEAGADDQSQELAYRKDTTLSMLKELEFDHQSGILTDEDFRELEDRYRKKAMAVLKEMDSLEKGADVEAEIEKRITQLRRKPAATVEDDIEREISALRKNKPAPAADEIEEQVSALRQAKGQFCPQCGARHELEDRFCTQCGKKLTRGDK